MVFARSVNANQAMSLKSGFGGAYDPDRTDVRVCFSPRASQ